MPTEQFTNGYQSSVTSGLGNVTDPVTFVVASAAKAPTSGNFRLLVEEEILLVTAVAGTSFTASRAQEGTTAVSHANGTTITEAFTAGAFGQGITDGIAAYFASGAATSLLVTAITAPGTPGAVKAYVYVDATSKNLCVKDDAGVVKHGVQTLASVTSKWVTSINDAGLPTATQPNFSDLLGNATGVQGGTGLTTAAIGDLLYASATTPTWSRLASVAVGSVLVPGGVNTAPAWSASPTLTSLSFGVVGASTLKIYSGGAGNNYGFGIQGNEQQGFVPSTAHFSFNGGGDINASGTNEIARFTAGGGLTLAAPTGGQKGLGSANISGAYYSNGTAGVGTVGTGTAVTLPLTAFTTAGGLVTVATGTSDERLKTFEPYRSGLEELRGLIPIRYYWNEIAGAHGIDRSREQFGFGAQNVRRTFPEAVGEETWADSGQTWLTVNDRAILGATVNAVNELDAEIARLKVHLAALEARRN